MAALAATLTISSPLTASAMSAVEIFEQDFNSATITLLEGNVLKVSGFNGQTMCIYNVAGVRVMNIRVEGNEKTYSLNLSKGCYIVQIGKFSRKILIK